MTISKTTNTFCEFHFLFWSGQRVFSKNARKFQYSFLSFKLSLTFVLRTNLTTSKQTINCLKINSGKFKIRSFRIGCWIPCAKYVNCCAMKIHPGHNRGTYFTVRLVYFFFCTDDRYSKGESIFTTAIIFPIRSSITISFILSNHYIFWRLNNLLLWPNFIYYCDQIWDK